MESDEARAERSSIAAELRAAERAAAAPYANYPELPRWYPAVAGAWFAALVGTTVAGWPVGLRIAVISVLITLLGAAVGWYRAKRGVEPSIRPGDAPREIARLMRWYYAVAGALLAVVAVCWLVAPAWVTVAVTFVGATVGLAVYEAGYRRAAQTVRARLA